MDYGDEANDAEEMRYAREEAAGSESDDEAGEDESSEPVVEQLAKNFSKR